MRESWLKNSSSRKTFSWVQWAKILQANLKAKMSSVQLEVSNSSQLTSLCTTQTLPTWVCSSKCNNNNCYHRAWWAKGPRSLAKVLSLHRSSISRCKDLAISMIQWTSLKSLSFSTILMRMVLFITLVPMGRKEFGRILTRLGRSKLLPLLSE